MCRRWTARSVFDSTDRITENYQYTDTPAGTFWCSSQTGTQPARPVLHHRRGAVPPLQVVPRPRDDAAAEVDLPGRRLLPAPVARPWSSSGPGGPGRVRPCTPMCSRRCPQARSPGSTTTRSSPSSPAMHRPGHEPLRVLVQELVDLDVIDPWERTARKGSEDVRVQLGARPRRLQPARRQLGRRPPAAGRVGAPRHRARPSCPGHGTTSTRRTERPTVTEKAPSAPVPLCALHQNVPDGVSVYWLEGTRMVSRGRTPYARSSAGTPSGPRSSR